MTGHPISNSEVSDHLRCARMHSVSDGRLLLPIRPESPLKAAEVGTAMHAVWERHYGGKETPEEIVRSLEFQVEAAAEGDWHKRSVLILGMYETYLEWLEETGVDAGMETVSNEQEYRRVLDGMEFIGKLDLLQRDTSYETAPLRLTDGKTTKKTLSQKLQEMQFSGFRQLIHYLWLLEPVHPNVLGVTVRIQRQIVPSERSSGPYITENQFTFSRADLRRHEDFLREVGPKILENRQRTTGMLPVPTLDLDCSWRCPYGAVCLAAERGADWLHILNENFAPGNPLARYTEVD